MPPASITTKSPVHMMRIEISYESKAFIKSVTGYLHVQAKFRLMFAESSYNLQFPTNTLSKSKSCLTALVNFLPYSAFNHSSKMTSSPRCFQNAPPYGGGLKGLMSHSNAPTGS